MRTFFSVTDFRFLKKVVLERIETANAVISQQNGHIYFVCFQTGRFEWFPPLNLSKREEPFWALSYD